jgi:hypothetical protein
VLIERRHEDDLRVRPFVKEAAGHFESGQPRHLHIQKDQFGLQPTDCVQRLDAIVGLADELDTTDLAEQVHHFVARELLIVYENGSHVAAHAVTRS